MNSAVLTTAIGVAFVFLAASLVASGVTEGIAAFLNKRGDYLLRGLREMLDYPSTKTDSVPETTNTEPAPETTNTEPATETTALPSERSIRPGTGDMQKGLAAAQAAGRTLSAELAQIAPSGATSGTARGGEAGSATPEMPLADIVLANPLVASLHRPTKPGRPAKPPKPAKPPAPGEPGKPEAKGRRIRLASYVSSRSFAAALLDTLVPDASGETTIDEVKARVTALNPDIPGRGALLTLLNTAKGDINQFRTNVEHWYDEQMDRVKGWYKRWSQVWLFVVGLVLAVVININSIHVARSLYEDEPLRDTVAAQAVDATRDCPDKPEDARDRCLENPRRTLESLPLPIGWDVAAARKACDAYARGACDSWRLDRWIPFIAHEAKNEGGVTDLVDVLGWLLTGFAVSFGAPFWFDALSKLGSLRTAGNRPAEAGTGGG